MHEPQDLYSSLVEGSHTFYAYATDSLGFDGNPTPVPWTIDTTPPTASITAKPTSPTGSTTASFSFSSNEGGSTFLCARDSATLLVVLIAEGIQQPGIRHATCST